MKSSKNILPPLIKPYILAIGFSWIILSGIILVVNLASSRGSILPLLLLVVGIIHIVIANRKHRTAAV